MNKKMFQMLGIVLSLFLVLTTFSPVSVAEAEEGKVQVPTADMIALAAEYNRNVGGQTLVVMHQGNVLLEEYSNGGRKDKLMMLASGSKSFVGVAALAAVEDGIIQLDDRVSSSLTEWKDIGLKSQITYKHLLQLTSGLHPGPKVGRAKYLTWNQIIQLPMTGRPGEQYEYASSHFLAFGEALQRQTQKLYGETFEQYLKRRILDPIGVKVYWISRCADDNPQLAGGAYMTASDWATFGEWVRNKGLLHDKQIIEADMFDLLTQGSEENPAYGLTWWLKEPVSKEQIKKIPLLQGDMGQIANSDWIPEDLFMAAGAGKQLLYIIPSLELVVVRQAPWGNEKYYRDMEFLSLLLRGQKLEETVSIRDGFVDHTFLQYLFSNTNKQNENKDSFQYVMEDATWHDDARDRDVPIRIYAPDLKHGEGLFPTIVFSHGGGESREAFTFLGTYWAERGYIVIFLTHLGSDRSVIDEQKARGVTNPLKLMAALDGPEKFHLRPEDVSFVVDQLVADGHNQPLLKGRVDTNRIGMGGQCAGSSTALAMVGLNVNLPNQESATFVDDRFKVALAMSPQSGGGNPKSPFHADSWKDIHAPTLVITGTADFNWIPAMKKNPKLLQMAYDGLSPGNKYLVEIKDAEHNAFTDSEPYYPARERDPRHHQWIQQASTAFFDTYLKGDEEARDWLQKEKLEDETDGECRQEQKHKDESTYSVGVISQMTLPDKKRDVDIQLRITYPIEDGIFPIIIFSHCIRGCKENFEALVKHWSLNGYIVIQMDSTDTPSMEESWKNRVNDIVCIIDSLESIEKQAHSIDGKMNKELIGVGGHLVGAYASSMLVGMKRFDAFGSEKEENLLDERIMAAMQLSPQGRGQGLTEKSWEDIHVPMLVAAGSNNPSRRTSNPSEWRTEPYEFAKPGDKYLLWIEKMTGSYAGLLTGADIDEETVSWIKNVTTAFWDASLKKSEEEKNKLRSDYFMKDTDGELLIKWK